MSDQGRKLRYPQASILANELFGHLKADCERISIAGSMRRRVPIVGDVEFVAVPLLQPGLFAGAATELLLERSLGVLKSGGLLRPHPTKPANGEKLKRFAVPYDWDEGNKPPVLSSEGERWFSFELYIAQKHSFGYHLAIRTGPEEISEKWVSQQRKGGFLPNNCVARQGRIWMEQMGGQKLDAPEPIYLPREEDFFELCGLGYLAPENRAPGQWRMEARQ